MNTSLPGGPLSRHHAELMLCALQHIAQTARNSSTSTRRLRWIERRAEMAANGEGYSDNSFSLPKYNSASPERKCLRLRARVKGLLEIITAMAADMETTCRSSYGRTVDTALDDWREADPESHALWTRAREAMASAADEQAAEARAGQEV